MLPEGEEAPSDCQRIPAGNRRKTMNESENKFTPADVIKAYKEKGLSPTFGCYSIYRENGELVAENACCCALGALIAGEKVAATHPSIADDYFSVSTFVQKKYPWLMIRGFTDGFDGHEPEEDRVSYLESYELGKNCRQAVLDDPELSQGI